MAIPEFLLRKLYVKNSYKKTTDGFLFELANTLASTSLANIRVGVDQSWIDPDRIQIQQGNNPPVPVTGFTNNDFLPFQVGTAAIVQVQTDLTSVNRLRIQALSKEFGPLDFSIDVGKGIPRSGFHTRSKDNKQKLDPIPFSEEDWKRVESNYTRWFEGDLKRPLIILETWGQQFNEFVSLKTDTRRMLHDQDQSLRQMRYYGDAFPKYWPNFGPGVMAAFLGSQVVTEDDTAWFLPPKPGHIPDFKPFNHNHNPWWQKALKITRDAMNLWGNQVSVGVTDIGGNLDILASLLGTEHLLTMLTDEPDKVDTLTKAITSLWLGYFQKLEQITHQNHQGTSCWGPMFFPGSGYYLQSDLSYMISTKMFERWVLPDLEACCAKMDYGFYHLDGKSQIRHLDVLLSIKNLHGIQWVPGDGNPPAEEWLPLLARIKKSGKVCQVGTSRSGALKIAKALGGKGFLFEIQEYVTPADAEAFLKAIETTGEE